MLSSLYLLLGVAATVLATHPHAHAKRQDSVASSVTKTVADDDTATSVAGAATTTSLHRVIELQEAQADYLMEVCMPNYKEFIHKYQTVAYTPEEWAAFMKKMGASEFPCELEAFHQSNCLDKSSGDETRDVKAEQDCLCRSNFFEMKSACFDCSKVHGLDPLEMDYSKAVVPALQTAFCSATKPVLYGDAYTSRKDVSYTGSYTGGDMMKFVTGTDLYPSQTDISHYYTAASVTTTAASSGAAQTTGTNGSAAPTATTTAPPANGAGQLKAAGAVLAALVGAMIAL